MFIAHRYLDHARNQLAELAEARFGPTLVFQADLQEFFDDPGIADQFSDSEGVLAEGRLEDGLATFYWMLPRRAADQ
jgi:hypothetical protein